MNIMSMVVTSYPISWERCLVLQMTAIKDCDFSVQASLMCWQSLKVIHFQHPYSQVTHSIPQCYTSLIPLHNPPSQHLHTSHSIPHFTTLTANRGSPNFHSTTCGSHLTCGLLGSPVSTHWHKICDRSRSHTFLFHAAQLDISNPLSKIHLKSG